MLFCMTGELPDEEIPEDAEVAVRLAKEPPNPPLDLAQVCACVCLPIFLIFLSACLPACLSASQPAIQSICLYVCLYVHIFDCRLWRGCWFN